MKDHEISRIYNELFGIDEKEQESMDSVNKDKDHSFDLSAVETNKLDLPYMRDRNDKDHDKAEQDKEEVKEEETEDSIDLTSVD